VAAYLSPPTTDEAFDALGDPTRRRMLELLRGGERAVGALAADLPVTRPAVSQHLKVLKGAGLVRERRAGTRHLYAIDPDGLASLRRYLEGFWDDALRAFEAAADAAARNATGRPGRREGDPR
jgi:DNA-binding transcriptional ArsR family regulator